jgi:hypothetical protein
MSEQQDRELRNAVFAAKEAAERAQSVTQVQAAKQNLGIEIPTAVVPLPSRGLVYPVGHPLANKEDVEIFGMTAQQEDILTNRALLKKGTVITELIRSCMVDKSVDVNSLTSGDRNALMVSIRITGYGADYTPTINCPACDHRQEFAIRLDGLNVKVLEVEPSRPGENVFAFQLPMSNKLVHFKFLTGREEEEIVATAEAKKKKGINSENTITTRLLYSIVAIDGNTDRNMIAQFVKFMPARDSLALRKYIDAIEPTIEMKADFTCVSCAHSEVMSIPMGPSFFWPDAGR